MTLAEDLLSADVREFIGVLDRHGVDYLLLGGHAVFFHGYPRLTADVDFAYRRTAANTQRLFAALREFWGGSVPGVAAASELEAVGLIIQFGRPPNRIDLLSSPDGLDFDAAWERRVVVQLGGGSPVNVIGLRDLRATKAAAGRPKDLDDLENLPEPE